MRIYCDGCSPDYRSGRNLTLGIHRALVIAGSITNAQRRTMKFEVSGTFSAHPEKKCDLIVNVGARAFLSFLYEEERPSLVGDMWLGRMDSSRFSAQMTPHQYSFNALALDESTASEIERMGAEKLYGVPIYIIGAGSIALREYDFDGSAVMFDISRK